jgi:ATP-binding cassette subfamily G (WHITE) protein 2 (SNQ2)
LILLVNSLLGLGEVVNSFKGRTILAKHKSMALYRPSALVLAQVMVDLPIVAGQVVSFASSKQYSQVHSETNFLQTVFVLPIYFMSGLRRTAGGFFTVSLSTTQNTFDLLGGLAYLPLRSFGLLHTSQLTAC